MFKKAVVVVLVILLATGMFVFPEPDIEVSGGEPILYVGPGVTNIVVTPDPTDGTNLVTVTATITDDSPENNTLTAAEAYIDDPGTTPGNGTPLVAVDGNWDSSTEDVTGVVDASSFDGVLKMYVRGKNVTPGWPGWGTHSWVEFNKTTLFSNSLAIGMNFLSIPVLPINTSITSVLSSIEGSYDYVQFYTWSVTLSRSTWSHYNDILPTEEIDATEDNIRISNAIGFYINITAPCTLDIYGMLVASPFVWLEEGWNLVGYPADFPSQIGSSMSEITWDRVQTINGGTPVNLTSTDMLTPGQAYWIYTPEGAGRQQWYI